MMKSMSYWKKRQRNHRLVMHTHAINVISVEKKKKKTKVKLICVKASFAK